jgi:hypothetical protein
MKLLILRRFMEDDSLVGHNGERAAPTADSFTALFL